MKTPLRAALVGAGYFARFQYESWHHMPEVQLVANCNRSVDKAEAYAREFNIPATYGIDQFGEMLATEKPDFVDLITPPETHLALCKEALKQGIPVICQKPLAPTWEETVALVELVAEHPGIPFMVHENWRWQPWYREMKALINNGLIGEVFHCAVHTRLGDGWGEEAYLARQPFFREYERLFIFETGVHFLDTFRFLFGEMSSVYARIARRNPVIKGEDSALIVCEAQSGVTATLDANRYNESEAENPRYTFGTVRIDGSKGHLELGLDGRLSVKLLGEPSYFHDYSPSRDGFAGNCVDATQRHFVDYMRLGKPFESTAQDYLKSVRLVEAAYQSASTNQVVPIS